MKRLCICLWLWPCWVLAARQLEVVATLPDVAALAREIAGERARVTPLLASWQSPYDDPREGRPGQVLVLSRADVLLSVGGALEAGWLPRLIAEARVCPTADEHSQPGARCLTPLAAEGDAGSYVLGEPPRAAALARAIGAQLGAASEAPQTAAALRLSAEQVAAAIDGRSKGWLTQLAPLRGQRVLCYDDSFRAFVRWAGLIEMGPLAPAPGAQPTPQRVLRALRALREGGARAILQREYEPAHVVRLLHEKTKIPVVVVPLGAKFERGERYVDAMDQLVQAVVAAHTP